MAFLGMFFFRKTKGQGVKLSSELESWAFVSSRLGVIGQVT